jgi:hypothetical protein
MPTPARYTWTASSARVIVLDGFGTIPRGTVQYVPQPLAWPAKDPGDTLDYVMDISEAIAGDGGDAIATVDVIVSPSQPGDLAVQSSCADGPLAVFWLSGGFSGTTYAVTITIGTNAGRTISRTVNLPVLSLATPPVDPGSLTDQAGAPIIDQNAQPLTT